MAHVQEVENGLKICLSRWEIVGGLQGEFIIPSERIVSDHNVSDGWQELRGWRCPGTGIPGVIMLGTMRAKGRKDFCAVYGHRSARVITCRDFTFTRVLVSDPK